METSGSCFSNSEPMDSDNDYTVVEGKRLKRKYRKTTKDVSEQGPTPTPPTPIYRIALVPLDLSKNLNSVHRQILNTYLGNVAPKGINEVRFNTKKNVVTVEVATQAAREKLKTVCILGHIEVRSFVVHSGRTRAGVISDVVIDISDEELQRLPSSTVKVIDFHRFGRSTSVKLLFEGDTLPDHVKVGYVRHPVRPYVPRSLQCDKCLKLGHVSAVGAGQTACLRCAGSHDVSSCTVRQTKYSNCDGPHEADSKDCPKQKKEKKNTAPNEQDKYVPRGGGSVSATPKETNASSAWTSCRSRRELPGSNSAGPAEGN
nr:uncharacterized protein LOC129386458 [Dermacentor andersoni]